MNKENLSDDTSSWSLREHSATIRDLCHARVPVMSLNMANQSRIHICLLKEHCDTVKDLHDTVDALHRSTEQAAVQRDMTWILPKQPKCKCGMAP